MQKTPPKIKPKTTPPPAKTNKIRTILMMNAVQSKDLIAHLRKVREESGDTYQFDKTNLGIILLCLQGGAQ